MQEEYEQEGIELGEISFADNVDVVRLIEGRVGIIAILNEEGELARSLASHVAYVLAF